MVFRDRTQHDGGGIEMLLNYVRLEVGILIQLTDGTNMERKKKRTYLQNEQIRKNNDSH